MICRKFVSALIVVAMLAAASQAVPVPDATKKGENKEAGAPVAISPDGQTTASAEGDTIIIFQNNAVRAKMKTASPVRALAYSPDGKLLASGDDRGLSLWDAATGKQILSFQHGNGAARSVKFSADGSQLTILTATAQVILEARTGKLLRVIK